MNPILKLKKIPDPRSSMIAKDMFPRMGMLLYQSKFVGKSHRKSDSGPDKAEHSVDRLKHSLHSYFLPFYLKVSELNTDRHSHPSPFISASDFYAMVYYTVSA